MDFILAVGGVFALLVFSELLWRFKLVRGEMGRKLVHVTVGTYVAFWPHFMSREVILAMCVAFLVVIVASWKLNVFKAIHTVRRKTLGEILFPVGIGLAALLAPTDLIFTAAILHLSLADGFAAIVGTTYGYMHHYKVFSYRKSFVGSLTFLIISTVIVTATVLLSNPESIIASGWLIIWLPIATTLVESSSVMGTDNVFIPLIVVAALSSLQLIG